MLFNGCIVNFHAIQKLCVNQSTHALVTESCGKEVIEIWVMELRAFGLKVLQIPTHNHEVMGSWVIVFWAYRVTDV